MNKKELVSALSVKAQITKKETDLYLKALLETISESLEKNEEIKLVGFGTFKVKVRAARKGINPQTGKKMKIPATKVVRFSAGKELKGKVNK